MYNQVMNRYRYRRIVASLGLLISLGFLLTQRPEWQEMWEQPTAPIDEKITYKSNEPASPATETLNKLAIKGRAPKTNYSRSEFGSGWLKTDNCDMRNIILNRDLTDVTVNESCKVMSGVLNDPYTGKTLKFTRGTDTSAEVQIDHVVALSDAWQKGAQNLSYVRRAELANDPLELLAVDGSANQAKSNSDAASWLPDNKSFRCSYVARQIAVKYKYNLWVSQAEANMMRQVLSQCPNQLLPSS